MFSDDDDDGKMSKAQAKKAVQVEQQDLPMVLLTINLNSSAYGNVSILHKNRKQTKVKTEKTMAQSEKVVKLAEKK